MSPPLLKKGCLFVFAISISSLQSLLLKPIVPGRIHLEYIPITIACPISKSKPRSICQKITFTCNVRHILIEEFNTKKAALVFFSPTLTNQLSQNAIDNFQTYVNRVVADTKDVYLSCGLFTPSEISEFVY